MHRERKPFFRPTKIFLPDCFKEDLKGRITLVNTMMFTSQVPQAMSNLEANMKKVKGTM